MRKIIESIEPRKNVEDYHSTNIASVSKKIDPMTMVSLFVNTFKSAKKATTASVTNI